MDEYNNAPENLTNDHLFYLTLEYGAYTTPARRKPCGLAFSIPVQFRYRCIKYASDSQGESYTG